MSSCHTFRPVPGQCGPRGRGPLPAPPFDPQDYWATRKLVNSLFGTLETSKLDKADVVDPTAAAEDGKAADAKRTQEELDRILGVASDALALAESKADKLSSSQLAAVNSGIDAAKVAKIARNEIAISEEVSRATTEEARLQALINAIKTFDAVVADSLPVPSEQYIKKLYLVPSTNPETRNVRDEFICVKIGDSWSWEQVGSTAITIEFDNEPTEGSQKAARSGGIWSWVKSLLPKWLTSNYAEPATVESVAKKADKATPSYAGNFAALTADGNLSDSGKKANDFLPATGDEQSQVYNVEANTTFSQIYGDGFSIDAWQHRFWGARFYYEPSGSGYPEVSENELAVKGDISGLASSKADKAAPRYAGNLAALTADGNLSDSGKKASDFAPAVDGGYLPLNGGTVNGDTTFIASFYAGPYGDILGVTHDAGYLYKHDSVKWYYGGYDKEDANEIAVKGDISALSSSVSGLASSKADKSALNDHVENASNPHAVTAEQAGAVPLVEDKNGNKTAVTIGSRLSGGIVGPGSLVHGNNAYAEGEYSYAAGYRASAVGNYSRADGGFTHAVAEGSYASGIRASTRPEDAYSFAWNGNGDPDYGVYYSHGVGTFNINPIGGLDGFYIGDDKISSILSKKADKKIPSANGNLAALTADGNLADSGIAKGNVATKSNLEGYLPLTGGTITGDLAVNHSISAGHNLSSTFFSTSYSTSWGDVVPALYYSRWYYLPNGSEYPKMSDNEIAVKGDISALSSSKADKTIPSKWGNLAALDEGGNIIDSYIDMQDLALKNQVNWMADSDSGFSSGHGDGFFFNIENGEQRLAVLKGRVIVDRDGKDAGERSVAMLGDINSATRGKADRTSLAPEYSATSAYSVGAIVYHDGSIYQCKAAIADGGEAWNAEKWELRKLDGFFTNSNSLLTGTIDAEVISKGTAPDAHLEAPTDEHLKLILADNSVAYDSAKAIPYKLTSVIGDRVVATMTLTAASTDITLPTIAANDTTVKDFILDVTNAYAVEGVATDAGINIPRTDFKLVTRDGESLTDVTTVKAGKSAFICFTQKSPVVVDGTTYPCWCVIQLPFGDPS